MGREVRMVPKNWNHPKERERFVPLFGDSYAERVAEWDEGNQKWSEGFRLDCSTGDWKPLDGDEGEDFSEWEGDRPVESSYMPDWKDEERTHLQMYETCTEGTPISPVCETPEELAKWLVDNDASAFASETASYEAWLRVAKGGFAASAVYSSSTGLQSGVEGMKDEG